ncbi:MAG: phosphopyruvate hydratase [Patescibacteria group bacterium]
MPKIKLLKATEILDSRGNPTIEVLCELESGVSGLASVPSGASTGIHEALELRDKDKSRYNGLGVLNAVRNVNEEINDFLKDKNFDQSSLDQTLIKLDGTENKSRLGANAILGVSLAFARACALDRKIELFEYLGELAGNNIFTLPLPTFNVINGGKHSDSGLEIQEFMIVPVGFQTFHEKVEAGAKIISCLEKILKERGYPISIGDEGGFAPKLSSNEEVFDILEEAISDASYSPEKVKISIDAAASTFYKDGLYNLRIDGKEKNLKNNELLEWYEKLSRRYSIFSIEDGFAEDDWDGFGQMTREIGGNIKIIGDDLTVTNIKRIKMAIEKKSINGVLIKLNQIGTLSETIQAILLTKSAGWLPFISHRSGETMDTFISDLVVGLSCQCIKAGSLKRGERVCKYDRLLEIENILLTRKKI